MKSEKSVKKKRRIKSQQLLDVARKQQSSGAYAKAADICENIVISDPSFSDAWCMLSMIKYQSGNRQNSLDILSKAIFYNPLNLDIHLSICRNLIAGNPGLQATVNKFLPKKKPHSSDLANLYTELGDRLSTVGRLYEGLVCYQQVVRFSDNKCIACKRLSSATYGFIIHDTESIFRKELELCLNIEGFDVQYLAQSAVSLIRLQPEFLLLINYCSNMGNHQHLESVLNKPGTIDSLCSPLLLGILNNALLPDMGIERLLTRIRQHVLELVMNKEIPWSNKNKSITFITALAQQCFMNEYVYYVTDSELNLINQLSEKINQDAKNDKYIDFLELAILGCYIPLFNLETCMDLLNSASFEDIPGCESLIRKQLVEPLQELDIRKSINSLTSIEDDISLKVRSQYEDNPYPRWSNLSLDENSISFRAYIQNTYPHATDPGNTDHSNIDLLVAGCGTGAKTLLLSQRFNCYSILAVDLSKASLSFATRKANELGIKGIEFIQGDILQLGDIDRTFDVIDCSGVLHHMSNPLEGWQVLTGLLKPGGFMNIGLYSEIARKPIVATRKYIKDRGYQGTLGGIREFRQNFYDEYKTTSFKSIAMSKDFFSASDCRDLLFHVQEHRFILPKIKEILEQLGLEFIGFESREKDFLPKYRKTCPSDKFANNLDSWHEYEMNNPNTFVAMYQFWVRKTN